MKESLRERVPNFLKGIYRFATILSRYPLCRFRAYPHFIIIGVQKGGTTTLFELLKQHPSIRTSVFKEVHYYDMQYKRGRDWYKSFFPVLSGKKQLLYGESSPYYFFHPLVPERVFRDNPNIKLILLLRDPVDRAYSHFQMERRKGREKLKTFEEAIAKESERTQTNSDAFAAGKENYNHNHHVYSYLARGRYDEQVMRWMKYFRREQLLVLKSEDFFASPHENLARVYKFLDVPVVFPQSVAIKNKGNYNPVGMNTMLHLRNYFQPHNEALSHYLGEEFQWE